MKQPQSITSLSESPDDDRRRRMTRYLIAMIIRVICIVLCLFVQGWWLLLPIIGAVVLPYIAVVLANVGATHDGAPLDRAEALVHIPKGSSGASE